MKKSVANQFEVLKSEFSDNLELLKVSLDDRAMSINVRIENVCKAGIEAGLIEDYKMQEGVVMIERLEMRVDGSEDLIEDDLDMMDWVGDLLLHELKRIVEVFFRNDCYVGDGENDLPF